MSVVAVVVLVVVGRVSETLQNMPSHELVELLLAVASVHPSGNGAKNDLLR